MTQTPSVVDAAQATQPVDPVESVVGVIPFVIPAVGAAMIFLLAFIAVYVG